MHPELAEQPRTADSVYNETLDDLLDTMRGLPETDQTAERTRKNVVTLTVGALEVSFSFIEGGYEARAHAVVVRDPSTTGQVEFSQQIPQDSVLTALVRAMNAAKRALPGSAADDHIMALARSWANDKPRPTDALLSGFLEYGPDPLPAGTRVYCPGTEPGQWTDGEIVDRKRPEEWTIRLPDQTNTTRHYTELRLAREHSRDQ
ncbi:hypothetical protein [Promicromonospora sp. NFX87]|uniref:hypothetical protein n=1 Tax=Promicromonospora sp. NFX87 TaxID=3402691 RepID=UPI003AFAD205